MIYFTSDTHFNHEYIRSILNRPVDDVLINNWNKTVKTADTVYHLGDFCFGSHDIVKKYRAKLNGKIHLILGNHDYKNRIQNLPQLFSSINDILTLKYYHQKIILCHYAMRVWNASHYNSYHLFGHSHGGLEGQGKSFDIGVDCWDYRPVSIDRVMEEFEKLPNNFNLVKSRT